MQHQDRHDIVIQAQPARVYEYLTQPWLWHEWHPSSRSASATSQMLQVGDEFIEHIELQPFAFLPVRLKRVTHYRVLEARPHSRWRVVGQLKGGTISIDYKFEPHTNGTQFTRTLSVDAHGMGAVWLFLMRKRTSQLALVALANLKHQLERSDPSD